LSAETLEGRTALVTGASRGIGLATAKRLASAGVRVALVARTESVLAEAAEDAGGVALAADVSDASAVAALARRAGELFGDASPDILVNAAGAFALGPLAETDTETFDRQLAVNLRAPFLVIRAFLSAMLERGSGHIVTIGSVAGRLALPGNGAYGASKFGVRGLHAVLDLELRGSGVRSTLVEPAATDTPLWDAIDRTIHAELPSADAMLDADDVADAVIYALTRPARAGIRTLSLERA
jgi:NADP-dependent 3-hydroxy acid dehydrogenase YdfG